MPRSHDPSRSIQRRTEVVVAALFDLTGGDPHPHWQSQQPLGCDGRFDSGSGRREGGTNAVPRMLEQPPALDFDRIPQDLVVPHQQSTHLNRIGFPTTC